MKIPARFKEVLEKNQQLDGAVRLTLATFEPWLADNKVVFFPEYTDHGPVHVERVMCGAEALIRDDAWPHVTPHDVATILLSILLHDCAMHLSHDGFLALVSPDSSWKPRGREFLDRMKDRSWPLLWQEFLREASRFDENKLRNLFGDTEPAQKPGPDWQKWTRRDQLLIGEFMRRHHARLAHEIALAGIPGPGKERLEFANMEEWLRDLAGFVARSHNHDLRFCADLMPKGRRQDYRGVHAPFAMALLRIADYLEIEAPRAPRELLRVRSLRSPISQAEWRKHAAVKHIQQHEDDPEALFVDADPQDVKTFLGLKDLFKGIQFELDACWSALGEVYGRDAKSRDLGLNVRRIRSTLDDVNEFGTRVEYLPVDARFRVSGAEVLKLLVGPLYGEEPSFGVRELMQNAVDACREREDYERQNPSKSLDLPDLEADVVVLLEENEDGTGWLTVEDRGIGMTPEVIQKYFLTAGASFRNSDAWHKRHDDESGKPRVLRTGRFGIGALAAFLVGPEMHVTTRHVEEERGVEFACRLEESEIELKWCERKVGTTVRVRIDDEAVMGRLLEGKSQIGATWDWYWLDKPRLVRKIRSPRTENAVINLRSRNAPSIHATLPTEWARIRHPEFDDIHWTYQIRPAQTLNNGFVVGEPWAERSLGFTAVYTMTHQAFWRPPVHVRSPLISVFDSAGRMSTNLVRTELTDETIPFARELNHSICRDILGAMLVNLPERVGSLLNDDYPHPALGRFAEGYRCLWWNTQGIGLVDVGMERLFAGKSVCHVAIGGKRRRTTKVPNHSSIFKNEMAFFAYDLQHTDEHENAIGPTEYWLLNQIALHHDPPFLYLVPGSTMVVLRHSLWAQWRAKCPCPSTSQFEIIGDGWVVEWTGDDKRPLLNLDRLAQVTPTHDEDPLIVWVDCELTKEKIGMDNLAQAWNDIIRQPVIPWDKNERRTVLAHAYKELAEEIARWEKIAATQAAKGPRSDDEHDD